MSRRVAFVATVGSGAELVVRQGGQFVILLVLARLATPADFGTVALLGVVVGVAVVVADAGLTTALLQAPEVSDADLDTAFWTTVAAGSALTVLGVAAAAPLASAVGRPALGGTAALLSVAVLGSAVGLVPSAVLVRRRAFGRLLVSGAVGVLLGGGIAVVVAAVGRPLLGLALLAVLVPCTTGVLTLILSGLRPRLRWERASATRLLGAGRWVLAANVLDATFLRVQVVVLGALFGPAALGRYQRADSTQQIAADTTSTVVGRVALPLFAASAHRPDLVRAGYLTGVRSVTAVTAPVMALLAALSTPVLETVFGAQWSGAGPLLSVLAVSGLLYPLHSMAINVLYAMSLNHRVFRIDVVKKVLALAALAVGATFGVTGVAWAQVAFSVAALVVNGLAVRAAVDLALGDQVRSAAAPAAVAVAVGVGVHLVARAWEPAAWVEVLVLGASGALLYLVGAVVLRVGAVTDLLALARRPAQEVAGA
ncbi:oligosaccharide flippase family protein [Phycicoccus avicenniae]|uniref:oligosaccharide flippase family protein n=1 Tax=Phycicoccus avicenniae TaxID=2828860 RepID=UPI003D2B5368